jgi:hypothetical protein
LTGPAASGAGRRVGLVGASLAVRVGVLLGEPGGQVAAKVEGPLLALVEGAELVLVLRVEHQVESGGRVAEPAAAEFFALVGRPWLLIIHGDASWSRGRCTRPF